MLRSVRPTTPEDAPEIAALLAESGLYRYMPAAEMQWKYWQARDDWTGPRSFVVARDREILSLRHFDELAYKEIAEALSIPEGTVMSRLFHARRRLREELEKIPGGPR